MIRLLFFCITLMLFVSCSENSDDLSPDLSEPISATSIIDYAVTNYFAHDTSLFTEGLLFHKGQLFESTGSPDNLPQSKSLIGISNLKTGKFSPKIEIDKNRYFGEGIVFWNNKLFQLTYQNQTGFIYDAKTFKQTGQFKYSNKEGWGLTTDGNSLIMSDGTDKLTFLDPITLNPIKSLRVNENGYGIDNLNELELIKGFIYANVWMRNFIVKIDPTNGKVVGKIDLTSLAHEAKVKNPNADFLNGIAYDSTTDKVYVTGKMWANIYEIQFLH